MEAAIACNRAEDLQPQRVAAERAARGGGGQSLAAEEGRRRAREAHGQRGVLRLVRARPRCSLDLGWQPSLVAQQQARRARKRERARALARGQ